MKSRDKLILKIFIILSLIGLAVSTYQTVEHYFMSSSICDLSVSFSCSVVTESAYGEFPQNSGIAVSFYGMVWWVAMLFISFKMLNGWKLKDIEFYLFVWVIVGLGSILYFIFIELVVLPSETGSLVICPFCTLQHLMILGIVPLSYLLLKKSFRTYLGDIFYK